MDDVRGETRLDAGAVGRVGMPDRDAAGELLGVREGESPAIVLTFGYPAKPRDPSARSVEEWSGRAKRRALEELVERIS